MQNKKQLLKETPSTSNGIELDLYRHRIQKFLEDYKKLCEKHGMELHMIPVAHDKEQNKDTNQEG